MVNVHNLLRFVDECMVPKEVQLAFSMMNYVRTNLIRSQVPLVS